MTKHFGISRGTPVQSLGKKAMGDHFPNMTALSAYFFLDRAKNGEQYRLTSTGQVIRAPYISLGGHILYLPPGELNVYVFVVDGAPENTGGPGNHTLRWDSSAATVTLLASGGVTNVVYGTNTATFDWNGIGKVQVNVAYAAAASEGSPYPRLNLRCIKTSNLALYDAGEIWDPEPFGNATTPMSVFGYARPLGSMNLNNTELSTWAERPQVDDHCYRIGKAADWKFNNWPTTDTTGRTLDYINKGIPIEMYISFCNKWGLDPHLMIPHMATDEYVTNMITLVNSLLRADLIPTLEYSNEFWNFGFLQWDWGKDQSNALFSLNPGDTGYDTISSFYGYKVCKFGTIAKAIMPRVIVAMAGQNVQTSVLNQQLIAQLWADRPNVDATFPYRPPHEVVDLLLVAPYPDVATRYQDGTSYGITRLLVEHPGFVTGDYTTAVPQLIGNIQHSIDNGMKNALLAHKSLAASYGIPHVGAYEMGTDTTQAQARWNINPIQEEVPVSGVVTLTVAAADEIMIFSADTGTAQNVTSILKVTSWTTGQTLRVYAGTDAVTLVNGGNLSIGSNRVINEYNEYVDLLWNGSAWTFVVQAVGAFTDSKMWALKELSISANTIAPVNNSIILTNGGNQTINTITPRSSWGAGFQITLWTNGASVTFATGAGNMSLGSNRTITGATAYIILEWNGSAWTFVSQGTAARLLNGPGPVWVSEVEQKLIDLFVHMTTTTELAEKRVNLLQMWKDNGGIYMIWLLAIGPNGGSGCWSLSEGVGTASPSFTAVADWLADNPRWWGHVYRQAA
jgi:hypothetical protein